MWVKGGWAEGWGPRQDKGVPGVGVSDVHLRIGLSGLLKRGAAVRIGN